VLGAGAKYHAITVSPEESQFLETIRANATTIAAIYGIYPAELIGGDTKDSMTYANVEQQSLNLATHTLRPWITKLEQHLSTLLPRPQFARFDLNDLLRADRQTRYETHQIAIANGFKTPDEVREEEGLEPLSASEKQELQQPALPAGNDQGGGQVVQLPRASNE
jgi:HK97 family phage portal protein